MKNNKDKKVKIILYIMFFSLLIISAFIFKDTYAVFETNTNGASNFDIGRWIIRVNELDISNGQTVNFSMDSFTYTDNIHIRDGYIAPGRSGYFDLVLDPTGTDVSIRYDITLNIPDELSDNISCYVTTNDGNTVRTADNVYSGILDLNSITSGGMATLRVNIEWANNSDYDNLDTQLGIIKNNKISIPASISVIQYLGEELEEYNEE